MVLPLEDILIIVGGTLAWLLLLAILSRFSKRRSRNGLPVNWSGLLIVAMVGGVVMAIGYRAYSHQGDPVTGTITEIENSSTPVGY